MPLSEMSVDMRFKLVVDVLARYGHVALNAVKLATLRDAMVMPSMDVQQYSIIDISSASLMVRSQPDLSGLGCGANRMILACDFDESGRGQF